MTQVVEKEDSASVRTTLDVALREATKYGANYNRVAGFNYLLVAHIRN